MTKRAGRSASNDPGFGDILKAEADAVCLVAQKLGLSCARSRSASRNEENLECIADSVRAVTAAGREALIDCEHFFDGFKADRDYALACARDRA